MPRRRELSGHNLRPADYGTFVSALLTQITDEPVSPSPAVCYRCSTHRTQWYGPEDVRRRNARLQPLCPRDMSVMTGANPCRG